MPPTTNKYIKLRQDCWLWAGPVSESTGYGFMSDSFYNGSRPAHRVVYEALIGAIPNGMLLDHLCRITLCINPKHLEVVTNAENQRRGAATKLQTADISKIRKLILGGIGQNQLAYEYGVHQSTISRIVNNKRWRMV